MIGRRLMTLHQACGVFFILPVLSVVGLVWFAKPSPANSVVSRPSSIDGRFGFVEPHDAPEQASALHGAWGRARFHWGLIQPYNPDEWFDAELSDTELDSEIASGREVVGLVIGVPEWARDDHGLPRGLYLSPDDPENLWAVFVREAVTRYRDRIDHWIVWNEPDIWDVDHPGFTWPGTVEDYVQLLRVSYIVAKDANPQSSIHLAAMSHWWDVQYGRELYFQQLLDTIVSQPDAIQNNYFYDAATLHLYFNPAAIYDVITQYQEIQSQHGIHKPIWLVETNAAPSADPSWAVSDPTFRVSLLEQAAYEPQGVALALAAGAARVGIYKLIDTQGDYAANPEPFGLLRADLTPRPAVRTTQVAFEQLAGVSDIVWESRGIVSQVVASRPGEIIRVLWSRIPSSVSTTIPALTDEAEMVDMWGNHTRLHSIENTYTLTLFSGECQETTADYCMIGGPPVYVIESVSQTLLPEGYTLLSVDAVVLEGDQPYPVSKPGYPSLGGWLLAVVAVFALAGCGAILRVHSMKTAHPNRPPAK